jgi:phage baseplate assembly protein W
MIDFANVSIKSDWNDYPNDLASQSTNRDIASENDLIFASDIYMFATGKMYSTTDKKLQVVSGIYNLAQSISHRLMTTRGEHPMDPSIGVPWTRYLGQTYYDKELIMLEISSEIAEEVLKDPRVDSIEDIFVNMVDINAIEISVVITPIGTNSVAEISFTALRGG